MVPQKRGPQKPVPSITLRMTKARLYPLMKTKSHQFLLDHIFPNEKLLQETRSIPAQEVISRFTPITKQSTPW